MKEINIWITLLFALFFAAAFFIYKKSGQQDFGKTKEGKVARNVIALFSLVMKMNGVVDKDELNIARKYFFSHFHGHFVWADNMLDQLNSTKLTKHWDYCIEILNAKTMKYDDRRELLKVLFKIGYTCNGIDDTKIELLRGIAKYLLIQNWDLASLEYTFECGQYKDRQKQKEALEMASKYKMEVAYTILGLVPGSPLGDVKNAYRSMAQKYHPDHLPAELNEEAKEMSATLFRQITEAYNYLIKTIK